MSRGSLLTVPNALSLARVALVPLFFALPTTGARVALVAGAAITDVLDGWLARRSRRATRVGAIIDPIADRLFVLGALAAFVTEGALSAWQCVVLLSRDVMTTIGFFVARAVTWLRAVELRARYAGKIVTALQVATLLALLLRPAAVPTLVAGVGVASAVAVADYTLMLWRGRSR